MQTDRPPGKTRSDVTGDPLRTLFVGRLNPETTDGTETCSRFARESKYWLFSAVPSMLIEVVGQQTRCTKLSAHMARLSELSSQSTLVSWWKSSGCYDNRFTDMTMTQVTGVSRCYGFVEFASERTCRDVYQVYYCKVM